MRKTRNLFLFLSSGILLICVLTLPWFLSSLGKPLFIYFLEKHFESSIQINKVQMSWLGPQKFKVITFSNNQINGSIQTLTSNVPFWKLPDLKRSFQLDNGQFSVFQDPKKKLEDINITLEGTTIKANGSLQNGSIAIQGAIESKNQWNVTAHIQNLPTEIVDHLLPLHGHLNPILGDFVSLSTSIQYQDQIGTINGYLTSPNIETSVNGLIQNQLITLNSPLTISIHLTKNLSEYLIKQLGSSSLTSIKAKAPILLTIFPEDTQIPLVSSKNLRIGRASLNLGQIDIENEKILFSLQKIFKNVAIGTQIPFWFAPFFFQIEDKLISLQRFDVLIANAIHLCGWGDLNWNHESLNMVLGIPADTLQRFFNLQNLKQNFVLKIPLKGNFHNPELDTGAAIAKITTMSATQQLPGKTGKIFGGIVNKITQKQDDDVPPPNRPFPWE